MYVYFIWKEYKSPKREVEGTTPPWGSDLPGWERIKEIHFTVIGNIKKAKTKLKQVQISLFFIGGGGGVPPPICFLVMENNSNLL